MIESPPPTKSAVKDAADFLASRIRNGEKISPEELRQFFEAAAHVVTNERRKVTAPALDVDFF